MNVYSHICRFLIQRNLMKRAENCVNAQINHVYFDADSLVFEFAKSKGHQKGEKHLGPWHVYANPHKPHICPILAMARYLFTYPDVLKGNSRLFEGKNQYSRYLKRFHDLLISEAQTLLELGYEKGDLGTHSVRKGVGSKVASGSTVSPPIVAICIRAGWVLGGVKDRYLFRENAGDQYVGRCATGLDQSSKEFAVSPPYFDYSSVKDTEKFKRKEEVREFLKSRLPNYSSIQGKTLHMATMCFASICHHKEYLLDNLHERCPLRASPMFRDIPDSIVSLAKVSYPWDKTADTPSFTGIPPHVLMLCELEEVKKELRLVREGIIDGLKDAMDERGFASHDHNTKKIIDAMNAQTQKIFETLAARDKNIDNIARSGQDEEAVVIEAEDAESDNEYEAEIQKDVGVTHEEVLAMRKRRQKAREFQKKRKYTVGFHHGKFNILPANYVFPTYTCYEMVISWLVGDGTIPPLWTLSPADVSHLKYGRSTLSNMQSFMRIIEQYGRRRGKWLNNMKMWNYKSANTMWESIREDLKKDVLSKSNRKNEMSYKRAYNIMSEMNVFGNKRNKKSKAEVPIESTIESENQNLVDDEIQREARQFLTNNEKDNDISTDKNDTTTPRVLLRIPIQRRNSSARNNNNNKRKNRATSQTRLHTQPRPGLSTNNNNKKQKQNRLSDIGSGRNTEKDGSHLTLNSSIGISKDGERDDDESDTTEDLYD